MYTISVDHYNYNTLPISSRTCSYLSFLPTELSHVMLCELCISQCYYSYHSIVTKYNRPVVYLSVENLSDQYALNIFQTFEFLLTAPRLYAYDWFSNKKLTRNRRTHSSSSRKFINSSDSICSNDSIGKGDGLLLSDVAWLDLADILPKAQ